MPFAFIIRRVVTALITLFLASVMVFGALLIVPGDPVQLLLGLDYNEDQYKAVQKQLGLDKPLLERYAIWISGLPRGDLGSSLSESRPVSEAILARLPVRCRSRLDHAIGVGDSKFLAWIDVRCGLRREFALVAIWRLDRLER
jgi:ABC-type microcin C transport system permease subunit YejB